MKNEPSGIRNRMQLLGQAMNLLREAYPDGPGSPGSPAFLAWELAEKIEEELYISGWTS